MYKILIVDDEITNSKILDYHVKDFFNERDISSYKIDMAENGFEAISMHFLNSYDLILLDVKMPKCDGLKVLSTIRLNKNTFRQPVITMVTAYGKEEYIKIYKNKGANSYLIKPFDKRVINLVLEHTFKLFNSKPTPTVEIKEESDDFEFDFDFDEDFVSNEDQEELNTFNQAHGKISATEFLKDYDNLEYILEEIEDIDLFLEEIIISLETVNFKDYKHRIEEALRKYASFANSLSSFGDMSSSISVLNNAIEYADFEHFDEKKQYYIVEIIRAILEDLQNWKDFVFVKQTANDVYYINASVLSNCIQLQDMLKD